jgi:hypothetical protein
LACKERIRLLLLLFHYFLIYCILVDTDAQIRFLCRQRHCTKNDARSEAASRAGRRPAATHSNCPDTIQIPLNFIHILQVCSMNKLILRSSAAALAVVTMSASAYWNYPPGYMGYAIPAATDEQHQAVTAWHQAFFEHQQAMAEQQAKAIQQMLDNQRQMAEQWAEQAADRGERPAMPDMPAFGETPAMPAIPDMPAFGERPAMPAMPDMPAFGERPAMPAMPDMPAFGERPAMPAMPDMPAFGERPAMPAMPDMPAFGERPAMPAMPDMPAFGERPAMPAMPALPRAGATLQERKARIAAHRARAKERLEARQADRQRMVEQRRAMLPRSRALRPLMKPAGFGAGATRKCEPASPSKDSANLETTTAQTTVGG